KILVTALPPSEVPPPARGLSHDTPPTSTGAIGRHPPESRSEIRPPESRNGCGAIAETLFASLQGQDCERRPRVRDVMAAVAVERAREPAARFALVGLQPGDPAPNGFLGSGDPGLTQDVQHQAGRVAVAGGVLGLRLAVLALP